MLGDVRGQIAPALWAKIRGFPAAAPLPAPPPSPSEIGASRGFSAKE